MLPHTLAVESVRLNRGHGPLEYLRVTRKVDGSRVLLGYYRSVTEIAEQVDLALLVEPPR